jgi:hypothetical protein
MSPSKLTTTRWRKLCDAAGRKPDADAEARATLAAILDEYPPELYDHKREEVRRQRLKRMVTDLAAFESDYRAVFKPTEDAVLTTDVKIRIRPDLWCLEGLRRRTELALLAAHARQRQNTRHRNAQHAMLYFRLCQLWLDHFQPGSELPPAGRFCTPLVDFILAAMRLVVPTSELPQRDETVRDAIERERTERANLKAWPERLRREREGG